MNTYDKHQLTARELQCERVPSTLEATISACLLAFSVFSVLIVVFNI